MKHDKSAKHHLGGWNYIRTPFGWLIGIGVRFLGAWLCWIMACHSAKATICTGPYLPVAVRAQSGWQESGAVGNCYDDGWASCDAPYDTLAAYAFALPYEIPEGSQIAGLKVTVKGCWKNGVPNQQRLCVALSKDAEDYVVEGEYKEILCQRFDEDTVMEIGGPNELWGAEWLPEDVNSTYFGVLLAHRQDEGEVLFVDCVQVTLYFQPPAGWLLQSCEIDSVRCDYSGEHDSVVLHCLTGAEAWAESMFVAISIGRYPDSSSLACRYGYSPEADFNCYAIAEMTEPCSLFASIWIWHATAGWVGRWHKSRSFAGQQAGSDSADMRVRTWFAKRAKTLDFISDADSLGYTNPDSTNLVDWHPEFNCLNITGYTSDSVQVEVYDANSNLHYTWKDTLVCPDDARTRNVRYPSNVNGYSGHSIVLQAGEKYKARMRLRSNGTWQSWSNWVYFYGIVPDSIDAANYYPGYRNYTMVWAGTDHDTLPMNYTLTVSYPTGWGIVMDTNGLNNQATPYVVHYRGFTYMSWQALDPTTQNPYLYLAKRNDSTGVWSQPTKIGTSKSSDALHYYQRMVVGADSCLHFVRGGHHDQTKYFRTKKAHMTGQGIDISDTAWYGGYGKSTGGNTSTVFKDTSKNWTESLSGWTLSIIAGTGAGQARTIQSNSVDSIIVSSAFTTIPDTSSEYEIYYAPAALEASTYPVLLVVNKDLFCFFRHSQKTGANAGMKYYCYTRLPWTGSGYGSWSDRKYIVNYHDNAEFAANGVSVYGHVYNIPGSPKVHLSVSFWDSYGNQNKGRAVAYIYSQIDTTDADTGGFGKWYQLESGPTPVGYTRRSDAISDSVIDYAALAKIIECHQPVDSPLVGPFFLGAQYDGVINAEENNYYPFVFIHTYPSGTHQNDETPDIFCKWDNEHQKWIRVNLGGGTLFRAKSTGNCDAYRVDIDTGSVAGTIKLKFKNKASSPETTETFDSLYTPADIWRAVNYGLEGRNGGNPSSLIEVLWVGNVLPPPCAESGLANGGTNRHSYLEIRDTTQYLSWTHHRGGHSVLEDDENRLYVYGVRRPTDKTYTSFGGEIARWTLSFVKGDNIPVITKVDYSGGSGMGIPLIAVVPRVAYKDEFSRNPYTPNYKELLVSRGRDIIWQGDKYVVNQLGGNDVRMVLGSIDTLNNVQSFNERNRVVENCFGITTTKISFKHASSIPAGKHAPKFATMIIMSGKSNATAPPDTASKVYASTAYGTSYESFETWPSNTKLDTTARWVVTPTSNPDARDSAIIYDCYDVDNYAYTNDTKVWAGSKYLRLTDTTNCEMQLGTSADRLVEIHARLETGGRVWLGLRDGSGNHARVGISGYGYGCIKTTDTVTSTLSPTYAPDVTGWVNETYVYASDDNRAYGYTSNQTNLAALTFGTISASYNHATGILVTVEGQASVSGQQSAIRVGLTKNGSSVSGNWKYCRLKAGSDTTITLGGYGDLWGNTVLTSSDLNNANFGVVISDSDQTASGIYIDHVTIKVYHAGWQDVKKAATGEYHCLQITALSDSIRYYVDGQQIGNRPAFTFTYLVIGSDRKTDALVDAIKIRPWVKNPPETYIAQSAEQILGSPQPLRSALRKKKLLLTGGVQ